jgi:hypothetical protein
LNKTIKGLWGLVLMVLVIGMAQSHVGSFNWRGGGPTVEAVNFSTVLSRLDPTEKFPRVILFRDIKTEIHFPVLSTFPRDWLTLRYV